MSLTDFAPNPAAASKPLAVAKSSGLTGANYETHDDGRRDSQATEPRDILTRADRHDMSNEERHQLLIRWSDLNQSPNIADELEDSELSEIGAKVRDEVQIDEESRADWLTRSKDAMDLALQVVKQRNGPWPGSSNVNFPIMVVAAIEFNARAMPAVIADRNVVKGAVFGDDDGIPEAGPDGKQATGPDGKPVWQQRPGALREVADRIAGHMSWQKTQQQREWRTDTDKLLVVLPIVGSAFRKSWFDSTEGRNASALIYPKNLVINYWASSIYDAPRVTEILERYPYEVEEDIRSGVYSEHDYGPTSGASNDPDAPYTFFEQHRRLDLDCDGYTEPYIVTVEKESGRVARIVARYDPKGVLVNQSGEIQKIIPVHYYTPYEFFPNPEGGIYGVGFGTLLGPLNEQINSSLNQMFDSATLQNNGGGFIAKGPSMHSGSLKFKLGEWKMLNTVGATMKDSIVPLNHPGPSQSMMALLTFLVEAAREVASLKDVLTGDRLSQNAPATTILALIEQGLKVFTAVFQRIHGALQQEYDKDYRLNSIYLEDESKYWVGNEPRIIRKDDYELGGAGIEPVSDPKTTTDMQRLGRAQFLLGFKDDPAIDGVELRKRVLTAAGIEKVDDLMAKAPPPNPALILETARLHLEVLRVKAQGLLDVALAYKALADGDKSAASIGFQFVAHQLDLLRLQMESLGQEQNGGGAEAAPGAGNNGGPLARVGAPSGNGAVPPISLGGGEWLGGNAPLGMAGAPA